MSTEEKMDEMFFLMGRTKKVNFIDKYIDYASDRAIIRHVGNYIGDILEELWCDGNIEGVIAFLQQKGYKVTK